MATAANISVDTEENRVTVEELTVHDQEVADYMAEFETDQREEALDRALRIGASALQLVDTSKEAEYVERRFEEMEREFEDELESLRDELDDRFDDDGQVPRILENHLGADGHLEDHLENAFGDDGQLVERLNEELGEDGEKIQRALDPDREGTPTYRLKQNILDEIDTIKQRFDEETGEQAVREETRLKGYDFEDQLQEILEGLVHQTPNQVTDTSEDTGSKGDSKKGDFVVTLDETGQRIAVEAKNGAFSGTVESEMEEAIENREADYGIFVASSTAYLPRTKVGWFSEFDQEYVVVALSGDKDDEIEPRFLKFAYHWARTRALLSSVEVGDEIDPEAVKAELDGIKDAIDRFRQIRTKCTDLEGSVNDIRQTLTSIEDDISSRITRLETELGAATG